jgi:hypothetical protein
LANEVLNPNQSHEPRKQNLVSQSVLQNKRKTNPPSPPLAINQWSIQSKLNRLQKCLGKISSGFIVKFKRTFPIKLSGKFPLDS